MRCPNCGNENPDDYTFCDECGAKLSADEGTTETATSTVSAPSQVVYAPAGAANGASGDVASGQPSQPLTQANSGSDSSAQAGTGEVCPNCGAPVVPGEAYCSECGAELPAGLTAQDGGTDSPSPAMEPYTPEPAAASAGQEAQGGTAPEEVPVTEDTTMPPSEEAPVALPGVTPIAEEGAGVSAPQEPAPVGAAATGGTPTGAGHAEWATDALGRLENAQQAMARGDFVGYGQHMSELRSFLESIAGGVAGATAGAAASQAAPQAAAQPSYISAPVEPAAEATTVSEAPAPTNQGAVASAAPAASAGMGQSRGSTMARLVVISSGAELPLPQQEEITVGREDPSSGIFPDVDLTPYGGEDGGVSRRHARLLHIGGEYFVEDLQSTNYTKVDGQRLPARVREKLEDGARLDFGRVAVIFRQS